MRTNLISALYYKFYRHLLDRGLFQVSAESVELFVKRFRENYVSTPLIRIGGENDGGYLVPDILNHVEFCFSPGVGNSTNFEKHLSSQYGIRSFLADASVEGPPQKDDNFDFEKKFLGTHDEADFISFDNWLTKKVGKGSNELLLQMDIEGNEYEVLSSMSIQTLKRFNCLVIEFHALNRLIEKMFFQRIESVFEKLYQEFSVVHVHPNNCCGMVEVRGVKVPKVVEATFLRKDYVKMIKTAEIVKLPHPLDRKNIVENEEIVMPKEWWYKLPIEA